MYVIVWEFVVRPASTADFERAYGSNGDWARLFGRSAEYCGTELLRDQEATGRYFTIDRWTSRAAYDAFRKKWPAEHDALDRQCEALTLEERRLGGFEAL